MSDNASTTTIGIVAMALLVALAGLVGASMGLIGDDEVAGGQSFGYNEVEHGISYIAFCGDANTNVVIEETWDKEEDDAAAIRYTSSGGDVTDIVYKTGGQGGGTVYHLNSVGNEGGFQADDGDTLGSPISNADPCGHDDVEANTIVKFEEYSSPNDWNISD